MERNFLATLAFSQGVPMISHGDELGRTQHGNNNAYCHDSELTWVDWDLDASRRELLDFARTVFRFRRHNPVFRRRRFFAGDPVADRGVKDVQWMRPDGGEMTHDDWVQSQNRTIGMLIHGGSSDEVDERGRPNLGQTLLLILNASNRARAFNLPDLPEAGSWKELVNTATPAQQIARGRNVNVAPHSLVLLSYEVT
jgi:glycogen operon protein